MASRDEIVLDYLERLPYTPYPVQEEAIYAWASSDDGIPSAVVSHDKLSKGWHPGVWQCRRSRSAATRIERRAETRQANQPPA